MCRGSKGLGSARESGLVGWLRFRWHLAPKSSCPWLVKERNGVLLRTVLNLKTWNSDFWMELNFHKLVIFLTVSNPSIRQLAASNDLHSVLLLLVLVVVLLLHCSFLLTSTPHRHHLLYRFCNCKNLFSKFKLQDPRGIHFQLNQLVSLQDSALFLQIRRQMHTFVTGKHKFSLG